MKLKSFFAETVEAALEQARREFGAEAVLLNSRRANQEMAHMGQYEVVCADLEQPGRAQSKGSSTAMLAASGVDQLSAELSQVRREMERLALAVSRSLPFLNEANRSPDLATLLSKLTAAEIPDAMARDIASAVLEGTSGKRSPAELEEAVRHEIAKSFRTMDQDPITLKAEKRLIVFVGPPGCGKTSSLVKIAVRECVAKRKPCRILSSDTLRIGATDQLRSYAAVIGVPFAVADTTMKMQTLWDGRSPNEFLFLDTPGFGAAESEDAEMWAEWLRGTPEKEVHLVVPASMRFADRMRICSAYAMFAPSYLLFTKLDETSSLGSLVAQSAGQGIPISYLTNGQRIPEDLERPDATTLAGRVLDVRFGEAKASAAAA